MLVITFTKFENIIKGIFFMGCADSEVKDKSGYFMSAEYRVIFQT